MEPTGPLPVDRGAQDPSGRCTRHFARTVLARPAVVRTNARHILPRAASHAGEGAISLQPTTQRQVATRRGDDIVQPTCAAGIRLAALARASRDSPTGGSAEAARLLPDYGRSASTWRNRTSQLRKWLAFCDEDDRCQLPATEEDVLAYLGYLSLSRTASLQRPFHTNSQPCRRTTSFITSTHLLRPRWCVLCWRPIVAGTNPSAP